MTLVTLPRSIRTGTPTAAIAGATDARQAGARIATAGDALLSVDDLARAQRSYSIAYVSDGGGSPQASTKTWRTAEGGLKDASFDRLVELKLATSKIAMHLQDAWRSGLFKQLDTLLDPEEWDSSDALPDLDAFRTFLRMTVFLGRTRRPSLGATTDGHILAAWICDKDRLTINCGPGDQVRWVLSRYENGERESAAGRTVVRRLPEVLAPYGPDRWFALADNVRS